MRIRDDVAAALELARRARDGDARAEGARRHHDHRHRLSRAGPIACRRWRPRSRLASFDDLSLDALRARRSVKWRMYPPDVLPAFVAEMDFPLAPPIREALLAAVENDDCGYPHPAQLGEAFAGFAAERYGWARRPGAGRARARRRRGHRRAARPCSPSRTPASSSTRRSTGRSSRRSAAAGRRVVEAPLALGDDGGWELDLDALERAFADGAAAYLLCNPHNPTGRVYHARGAGRGRASSPTRYGVIVLSDEIHAPLTLDGRDARRRTSRSARRRPRTGSRSRARARRGTSPASRPRSSSRAPRPGAELAAQAAAAPAATTRATSACSPRSRRSPTAARGSTRCSATST